VCPAFAVDPGHRQSSSLGAEHIVYVAVADVQYLLWLQPQAVERHLEDPPIRLVGAHGFGDEDEVDRQVDA
jgi:hypothetical protein